MSSKVDTHAELSRLLEIDTAAVLDFLVEFVRCEIRRGGCSTAVLGLSGGVDSALAAAIAVRALGPENVYGIFMPYRSSDPQSQQDAKEVAADLALRYQKRDISQQVDAYFSGQAKVSKLRRGNKMARERMAIVYDASQQYRALVIGTSNKTELLLGYGTLFGDMASAINPLGDLYKTQIWMLAKAAGLSESVIKKAPSADLWAGQSDEDELGFAYRDVDALLVGMVDHRMENSILRAQGMKASFIKEIRKKVERSQFKRLTPIIAKVGARTLGREFRYPRDWGTSSR